MLVTHTGQRLKRVPAKHQKSLTKYLGGGGWSSLKSTFIPSRDGGGGRLLYFLSICVSETEITSGQMAYLPRE